MPVDATRNCAKSVQNARRNQPFPTKFPQVNLGCLQIAKHAAQHHNQARDDDGHDDPFQPHEPTRPTRIMRHALTQTTFRCKKRKITRREVLQKVGKSLFTHERQNSYYEQSESFAQIVECHQ